MRYLLLARMNVKGVIPGAIKSTIDGEPFDVTAIAWNSEEQSHTGAVINLPRKGAEAFIASVEEAGATIYRLGEKTADDWLQNHGLQKLED